MEGSNTRGAMTLNELEKHIHTMIPDLALAAEKPAIRNPFVSGLNISKLEGIKMVIFGIVLVPIRFLLTGIMFLLASLLSTLCLVGYKPSEAPESFTGVRRIGQHTVWFMGRCLLFMYGFFHIKINGKLADSKEAPVVVIAPHASFIDGLLLGGLGTTFSPVERAENNKLFLVGSILQLIQPLAVDRTKKDSKQYVIKELNRRTKGGWPRIILFPEGTTTNQQAFITFKPGAFYPGLPVQPIILQFKDELDYGSWTWMGPSLLQLLVIMTSRPINKAEVEILPVYKPSQEEIEDPFLFSRNVRDVMAKAAGVPVTDHSYEDCRLMMKAQKLGLPMQAGIVEYYKLSPMIGMNCECMMDYLKKFAEMDLLKDGYLDIQEFCEYLNLPLSEEVKTIFRIYDIDRDGKIMFREYLLGFILISRPFNTEENIQTAFSLFDPENTGSITYENFSSPLKSTLELQDKYVTKIFKEIDSKGTANPDYAEFREFCLNKPEYALLFIHFRKLQLDSSSMTFSNVVLRRTSVNESDTEIINSLPEVAV